MICVLRWEWAIGGATLESSNPSSVLSAIWALLIFTPKKVDRSLAEQGVMRLWQSAEEMGGQLFTSLQSFR